MGSSKKVTVGYRYYMGLHFGLCHGPVDYVSKVLCGDRDAWSGMQASSGSISIGAGNLFGGDEKEGGIVGTLDVMMGEPTQGQNSYLVSKINASIPAFRGILSAVWRAGQVSANNPYVKPWAFRVSRINKGWSTGATWYPEKARIPGQCAGWLGPLGICFVIDASGSMDGAPIQIVKDSLSQVIESLKSSYGSSGVTLDVAVACYSSVPYSPNGTSIIRRGASSSDLDDVKAFVNAISPAGGTEPKYGFSIANSFVSGTDPLLQSKVIHLTDGRPLCSEYMEFTPEGMQCAVDATLAVATSVFSQADVHTININLEDTTYSVQLDNTPDDGVPVLSSTVPGEVGAGIFNTVANFGVLPDMNPAHIIYQCLTDTQWGMGYPTAAIDNDSFKAAADALYIESFGLSMLWSKQETIENFIQIVLDHIGAILYVQPSAGTFALKLIRSDYNRALLPLYGPESLISAEDYQRQAWGETVNEVTIIYTDCAGKDAPITVHDLANIQVQGGIVTQTRHYPGIHRVDIAQRVALRDLQSISTPLARIKLTSTRAAWQVFPGDVFRLSWPEYGIDDVVYRALAVNLGTLQDGRIIIDAVEDVFGLPDNTYLVEQPGEWEDPSSAPAPAPYRKLLEAPYWDLARTLSAADLAYVDALSGYLETLAVRPSGDATNYSIYAKIGATEYEEAGNGDFCPSATIVDALGKTTTAITLANGVDLDLVTAGGYAVIDDEYVMVSAIDAVALTATISRGVLDTVPVAHTAAARIWFADGDVGFSTTEYSDTEVLDVKLLPITGQGALDITEAPADAITFDQRQYRPYPPGNVLVNTSAYPVWIAGTSELTVSWSHRDRLAQTAYLVEQDEASIGPEAGTTYTLRIYGETGTLGREIDNISSTSYLYTSEYELTDFPSLGTQILWTPAVITTRAWYDFSDESTVTVVSDAVSQITDKSGNGYTLTQGTSGYRPNYTSSLNGLKVATFDGVDDRINAAAALLGVTHSLFIVFKPTIESAIGSVIGQFAAGQTGRYAWNANQNCQGVTASGRLNVFNSTMTQGACTGGGAGFLVDMEISNAATLVESISATGSENFKAYKNGGLVDSCTVTAIYTGVNTALGSLSASSGASPYDGQIAEVVIVAAAVDTDTRQSIEGYLAHKWGFQGSLDASHPYKTEAPTVLYGDSRLNGMLRFELESVRGALPSYQHHDHSVIRDGWGYNYGHLYGGGS